MGCGNSGPSSSWKWSGGTSSGPCRQPSAWSPRPSAALAGEATAYVPTLIAHATGALAIAASRTGEESGRATPLEPRRAKMSESPRCNRTASASTSRACHERGTSWPRRIFMRRPGTCQTPLGRLISDQVASVASLRGAAARTMKRTASLSAGLIDSACHSSIASVVPVAMEDEALYPLACEGPTHVQVQAVAVGVAAGKHPARDQLGQLVVGMPPGRLLASGAAAAARPARDPGGRTVAGVFPAGTGHDESLPSGNGRGPLAVSLTETAPRSTTPSGWCERAFPRRRSLQPLAAQLLEQVFDQRRGAATRSPPAHPSSTDRSRRTGQSTDNARSTWPTYSTSCSPILPTWNRKPQQRHESENSSSPP